MTRSAFTGSDKEFIESAIFFFLATADAGGPSELAFPDFGGNGIFKSLGNVASNRREFPEPAWKSFPEFNDVTRGSRRIRAKPPQEPSFLLHVIKRPF